MRQKKKKKKKNTNRCFNILVLWVNDMSKKQQDTINLVWYLVQIISIYWNVKI